MAERPEPAADEDVIGVRIPARLAFLKDALEPVLAELDTIQRQKEMGLPTSGGLDDRLEAMRTLVLAKIRDLTRKP
jgi:hypothetical protein